MTGGVFHYQTSEKVRVEYEVAPVYLRCAALIVDLLIKSVIFMVMYFAMIFLLLGNLVLEKVFNIENPPPVVLAGIMIIFLLMLLFYNLIFEQVWKGQTPGKRIMRMRAVNDDGTHMGFAAVVLRNTFRIVDMLPLGYLAGLVTMSLNSRRKRIGDYVAGTIVVRERGEQVPDYSGAGGDLFAEIPGLAGLVSPAAREIMETYFRSRKSMEAGARERVEREIVALMEPKTGVRRPDAMPAADYIAALYRALS
jgi:uncharacterized RDD family membrane protein YckC